MICEKLHMLWRPIVLGVTIIVLFCFALSQGFGSNQSIPEWISNYGIYAPLIFIIVYLAFTIAAFPMTIFGIIAGTLFGGIQGVILVSASSTLGCAISFLLARHFGRKSIEHWIAEFGGDGWKKLDKLSAHHGAIAVAIARIIPFFPYNLLNYAFGLTGIKFRTYLFWSWLCMLPGTIMVVIGSDVIVTALYEGRIMWEFVAVVLISTVILLGLIGITKKQLQTSQDNKKV